MSPWDNDRDPDGGFFAGGRSSATPRSSDPSRERRRDDRDDLTEATTIDAGRRHRNAAVTDLDDRRAQRSRPTSRRDASPRSDRDRDRTNTARRAEPTRRDRTERAGDARLSIPAPWRNRMRPADVDDDTFEARSTLRMGVFLVVTVLLFSSVVIKLVDVQFNQRSYWESFGADSRRARDTIRVDRGTIYDRNGAVFATSVYRPNVVADPTEIADKGAVARKLAPILEVPESTLRAKFAEKNHYQLLARNVDADVMAQLVTGSRKTPIGIYYEYGSIREYPSQELGRSIVGRTFAGDNTDAQGRAGRSGIEQSLDEELSGEPGYMIYDKDRQGGPIAGTDVLVHEPRPGMDVYLTLDQSLQYATQEALTAQLEELQASEATAVITKPSTGEVLAMVTVAHDENGKVAATTDNRGATTIYEPGSVMKMITVAAGIEEGQIQPDTQRRVPDHLQMANKTFTDHDPHPDELWSTTDIISNSSNIGAIQIAQDLGEEKLDEYLRSFGFGSRTGSDISGELKGLLPKVDDWSGTTLGSISIGQTVAVTPLQLLAAYNVVANDGVYVAPHVVGSTDRGSGKQSPDRPHARRVVSERTAAEVEAMLAKVVADGTGRGAAVPGYIAYGKTGTARIPQANPTDPTDGYLNEDGEYEYASTFVGGVRGADLTMLVMVKDPQNQTSGGEAAAPVFAKLAALTLRTMNVPPQVVGVDPMAVVPEISSSAKSDVAGHPRPTDSGTQG